MVESTNSDPQVSNVLFPHTAARSDTDNSGETGEAKGGKLNNSAALTTPKPDLTKKHEPDDLKAAVEDDKAVRQTSESPQNDPPGSRVDILA